MILLPWRRLLIRDNQLTLGAFVKVVILGLGLCNYGETKKKGETRCKIQSRPALPNADSTGLWFVTFGWGYVAPRRDVPLWSTFFEGTEKIHMFDLPPVKAINSDSKSKARQ